MEQFGILGSSWCGATQRVRMKKLGIVRPGREDDASVASEAQWGTEWQALA